MIRITAWTARKPTWTVHAKRNTNPHDWYGVVVRLHKIVVWLAL